MKKISFRQERIEKLIMKHINTMFISNYFNDVRITGTSLYVVSVEISPDISFAKVFLSSYSDDKVSISTAVNALNHAHGFVQYEIAKILQTRLTPKIRFIHDDTHRKAQDVLSIIDSLDVANNNKIL